MLFAVEQAIVAYAPRSAAEAYAVLALTDHLLTDVEFLGERAEASRERALCFMGVAEPGRGGHGHGC
jgi:hypothetical protein